jgi:hypothetical protein
VQLGWRDFQPRVEVYDMGAQAHPSRNCRESNGKRCEGWKNFSDSREEISRAFEVNGRVRWLEPGTAINT